ncbi:hypothetical protein Q8A73_002497 [Channa argus]|nr:hypothetical protein Q8A73_002497 [Channa argus]
MSQHHAYYVRCEDLQAGDLNQSFLECAHCEGEEPGWREERHREWSSGSDQSGKRGEPKDFPIALAATVSPLSPGGCYPIWEEMNRGPLTPYEVSVDGSSVNMPPGGKVSGRPHLTLSECCSARKAPTNPEPKHNVPFNLREKMAQYRELQGPVFQHCSDFTFASDEVGRPPNVISTESHLACRSSPAHADLLSFAATETGDAGRECKEKTKQRRTEGSPVNHKCPVQVVELQPCRCGHVCQPVYVYTYVYMYEQMFAWGNLFLELHQRAERAHRHSCKTQMSGSKVRQTPVRSRGRKSERKKREAGRAKEEKEFLLCLHFGSRHFQNWHKPNWVIHAKNLSSPHQERICPAGQPGERSVK